MSILWLDRGHQEIQLGLEIQVVAVGNQLNASGIQKHWRIWVICYFLPHEEEISCCFFAFLKTSLKLYYTERGKKVDLFWQAFWTVGFLFTSNPNYHRTRICWGTKSVETWLEKARTGNRSAGMAITSRFPSQMNFWDSAETCLQIDFFPPWVCGHSTEVSPMQPRDINFLVHFGMSIFYL